MSQSFPTDFANLPVELVAHVASFLALGDLRAFRLTSSEFAQVGLDFLIPFRRRRMYYHDWSRANLERELVFMSKSPKMLDSVNYLSIHPVAEPVEDFLSRLYLPSLKNFQAFEVEMSAAYLTAFISKHAPTLRKLYLDRTRLFATDDDFVGQKTVGWSMVMDCVASHLHLKIFTVKHPGYISETGDRRVVAPCPEKRCGSFYINGCCEETSYDKGAFIDFSFAQATAEDAVARVARAFVDEDGRERFCHRDDVDMEPEGIAYGPPYFD